MNNNILYRFLFILIIFKFFLIDTKGDGKVKINKVFLIGNDAKEIEIDKEIIIIGEHDKIGQYNYDTKKLLDEVNDACKIDDFLEKYTLKQVKFKDEEMLEYNGYDDKINLFNEVDTDLVFEKNKLCNVKIKYNGKDTLKTIYLKSNINKQYLIYKLVENFNDLGFDLSKNDYIKYIKVDNKELDFYNFNIKNDTINIEIEICNYIISDITLNLNNTTFKYNNLKIEEKYMTDNELVLMLLSKNVKNIENYEALKDNTELINFDKEYDKYIVYNVIEGNNTTDNDNIKVVDYKKINDYLNTKGKHLLTVNVKNYIEISVKINNADDYIFSQNLVKLVTNKKQWKCKKIADLKNEIKKTLNIRSDENAMEIYIKDNNKDKVVENQTYLIFNEQYIVKLSDKFLKEKEEDKDKDTNKNGTNTNSKSKKLSSNYKKR